MQALRSIAVSVTLTVGSLTALAAWAGSAVEGSGFISVKASTLKWADAPSIGHGAKIAVIEGDLKAVKPFIFRLKVPANLRIGVHTHPVAERVTILGLTTSPLETSSTLRGPRSTSPATPS